MLDGHVAIAGHGVEGDGGDLSIRSSFGDPEMQLSAEEATAVGIDAIDRCLFVRVEDLNAPVSEALSVDFGSAETDRYFAISEIGRCCVAR